MVEALNQHRTDTAIFRTPVPSECRTCHQPRSFATFPQELSVTNISNNVHNNLHPDVIAGRNLSRRGWHILMGATHIALLLPPCFRHFPVDEAGEVTLTLHWTCFSISITFAARTYFSQIFLSFELPHYQNRIIQLIKLKSYKLILTNA